MVRAPLRQREPRWRVGMAINGVGAVTTGADRHDRRRLEVHRGRLDPGRADPDHGRRVPGDRTPLRPSRAARRRRAGLPAAPRDAHDDRARRRRQQGRAPRHPVRPLAPPRPHRRPHRRQRRRGPPAHRAAMGRVRDPDRAAHRLLAVPRADAPVLRFIDEIDAQARGRHHHRRDPRVRHSRGARSGSTTPPGSRSRPGCCTGRTPPSCRCRSTWSTAITEEEEVR